MLYVLQTLRLKPAPKALFTHIYDDEVSIQVAKQLRHIAIFFKGLIN